MSIIAEYGPPLIFLSGVLYAFSVVVRFNLETWRIAKNIKEQAAAEGAEWEFFGRRDRMRQFLFHPSALIEPNDSAPLLRYKQLLIAHRQTMWRRVFFGWGIMLATIACIALFLIGLARFG